MTRITNELAARRTIDLFHTSVLDTANLMLLSFGVDSWFRVAQHDYDSGRLSIGEQTLYRFARYVWDGGGSAVTLDDLAALDSKTRAATLAILHDLWVGTNGTEQ